MPARPRSTPPRARPLAALLTGVAIAALWTTPARAQTAPAPPAATPPAAADTKVEVPKGTVGAQATASTGATNLDEAKFATTAAPAPDVTHATELDISAGGLFNSGNARSMAATAGGRFRIRRKIHEFSAGLVGNYGRASAPDPMDPTVTKGRDTANNIQGRLRYDVFFHPRISFFAMVTTRYDPFLGLKARIRADPGFAFFALQQPKHRLWGEIGYDIQYDRRRVEDTKVDCTIAGEVVTDGCFALRLPNGVTGAPVVDDRLIVHSMRLFAGYVNQLSDAVSFTTGLEYIQGLSPLRSSDVGPPKPGQAVEPRVRMWVNWDAAVNVALYKSLSFATTFTLRHDNAPLPGVRKLDTITAVSLTYKFF